MSGVPNSEITESFITLTAADGFTVSAYRATPKTTPRAGLVVLQEIFGLTEQMKSTVKSFAADGYDTIFPCVFDRVSPNLVVPFTEPDRGRQLAYGLAADKVRLDVAAAMNAVDNAHGVFVLGYCWGGGVVVDIAASLPVAGAIAFYGTRLDTYLQTKPNCPLLFHFGETDPNSKPELIASVKSAFPAAETYNYQAGHAFANDQRPSYVAEAATLARARSLAFMQKHSRI